MTELLASGFDALTDDFEGYDFETETDNDDTPERCSPIPYKLKPTKKRIAIVDCETDPFEENFIVKPFALGFDTDDRYVDFWGDDCVDQFFAYLATLEEEFIIYAHNGGKFDFFFFLKYLDAGQSPLIMNGRLVKIMFAKQEFRDSFAIFPFALAEYKKDEIDYRKFSRNVREQNKPEIRRYLRSDCEYLRELVIGFHNMFGDKLTIASASLPMLASYHGFERIKGEGFDARFRDYYFGGRNQCFETGLLRPRNSEFFYIYDRNSMYPAVMRDELHPISNNPTLQRDITDETDFACIDAVNMGALPTRGGDGGLDFTVERGTFFATIHEIKAGLDTGTLRIERVRHAWAFDMKTTFGDFVNTTYQHRLDAKANKDQVRDIIYKFALNSSYGKFALNPRKFRQWCMTIGEIPQPQASDAMPEGWSLHSRSGDLFIWSRPNPRKGGFYNVATAASITGAARANLLRNLALAERPIYCDTDSIICESFTGPLDDTALGGWKLEKRARCAAIGGKKLYALYDPGSDEVIKKASKGVRLTPAEIIAVCNGQEIVHQNPVPNFHLDGTATFVTRRINRTGAR